MPVNLFTVVVTRVVLHETTEFLRFHKLPLILKQNFPHSENSRRSEKPHFSAFRALFLLLKPPINTSNTLKERETLRLADPDPTFAVHRSKQITRNKAAQTSFQRQQFQSM